MPVVCRIQFGSPKLMEFNLIQSNETHNFLPGGLQWYSVQFNFLQNKNMLLRILRNYTLKELFPGGKAAGA
jgi:hypothetical protein